MRSKLKFILLAAISTFSFFSLAVGTVAWFNNQFVVAGLDGSLSGDSAAAYFASGDGTTLEKAYSIKTPRHLYNLAWLQYSGAFNKAQNGQIKQQYYFSLDADIDMTGWELPPIGTEDNPFLGCFNGNDKTISNLTVSNQASFSKKPTGINYNKQPNIVGLFGVIGDPELSNLGYTYDPDIVAASDFTLSDVTVKSQTANTLIGIAVGFNGGDIEGIKVAGNATIDVNGQQSSALGGRFSKLSHYGLVGYSNDTNSSGSYSQSISSYYDSTGGGGGGETGWGGSFDTVALYQDLKTKYNNATLIDEHEQVLTLDQHGDPEGEVQERVKAAGTYKNYRNGTDSNWTESICFSNKGELNNSSSNSIQLSGSTYEKLVTIDKAQSTKRIFFFTGASRTRAFAPRPNASVIVQQLECAEVDGKFNTSYGWLFSKTNATIANGSNLGYLSCIEDGVQYYLSVSNRIAEQTSTRTSYYLEFTTTPAHQWTLAKPSTYYTLKTTANGKTLYYRQTGRTATTNGSTSLYAPLIQEDYLETRTESNVLDRHYDTVIPHKTGYLVSGSTIDGGDLAVSNHCPYKTFFPVSDMTPLTINSSGKVNASSASFSEYSATKSDFDAILEARPQTRIDSGDYYKFWYGLRFMDAGISTNETVTMPTSGLELPKNSLTFNVRSAGLAKFFAGTYANSEGFNNTFFSLYKINRTGTSISSLQQVKYIWKTTNSRYIYTNTNSSPETGATLVFNHEWITNPGSNYEIGRIYYFEIPLNAGEYCLGTVQGTAGSYLMYLDIGANGSAAADDAVSAYSIHTISTAVSFVVGVDFDVTGAGDTGGDSICIGINSLNQGVVTFNVNEAGTVINVTDTSSITQYTYKSGTFGNTYTVSGNSPGDMDEQPTNGTKVTHINVVTANAGTQEILMSTNMDTAVSTYKLNGVSKTLAEIQAAVPALTNEILTSINGLGTVVTLTKASSSVEFNVTMPNMPWASDTDYVVITTPTTGLKITVDIEDGYTLTINGTSVSDGGTYQA